MIFCSHRFCCLPIEYKEGGFLCGIVHERMEQMGQSATGRRRDYIQDSLLSEFVFADARALLRCGSVASSSGV